jgi:D-alanine-D-alanine ligase
VLYGGISAEREVSLSSGRQVIAALETGGFAVRPIEVGRDLGAVIAALDPAPDVVFNALHGRYGEDGVIQGVLDWLGLRYTHSSARASALAMDKVAARAIFEEAGLPVAQGTLVDITALADADPWPLPYVVKPVCEGSSVGVHLVRDGDNRRAEIAQNWRFGAQALVEEYIPGRELTVGVLGDRALAVTEIAASHEFYDYESKYADGGSRHTVPADIPRAVEEFACQIALAAHRALGCEGASRADFRYDDTVSEPGRLVLLEVNTQPGMTQTSLLPEQAAFCGIGFVELCAWMVEHAACHA